MSRLVALDTLAALVEADWGIWAHCDACGAARNLDLPKLAEAIGGATTVQDLRRRLVCTTCGEQRAQIRLSSDHARRRGGYG